MKCNLCPRGCLVDRNEKSGFCGQQNLKIANYGLFHWEEPCISYEKGSGAIFFSGCSLKCVFCQNYEISSQNVGQEITVNNLAKIFEELDAVADNINLVNPTHFSDKIIEALKIYKPHVPVVYNTHGYELESEIIKLAAFVDIFLTDLKYYDNALAEKLSGAKNYFQIASKAIDKMIVLKPNKFEGDKMTQGVIIRHLILPNHTDDSKRILEHIKNSHPDAIISLMGQYIPCGKASLFADINRKLTAEEYDDVTDYAYHLGLDGYMQELSSADEMFIPKFSNKVI